MKSTSTISVPSKVVLAIAASVLAASIPARGAVTFYGTESEFRTALGGTTTVQDFEGYAPGTDQGASVSFVTDTVTSTLTTSQGNLYTANGRTDTGVGMSTAIEGENLIVTLGANGKAAGGYFYLTAEDFTVTEAGTMQVAINDGTSSVSPAFSGVTFLGWISDGPTASMTMTLSRTAGAGFVTFDDFVASPVPEPSTWIAAGFVGVVVFGRMGQVIYRKLKA